jgi:hypothetical protein
MVVSQCETSFGCFFVRRLTELGHRFEHLYVEQGQANFTLVGVDERGSFNRILPGYMSELLVKIDAQTKVINVFSAVNLPNITVVSTVGSSIILEQRDGQLVELDQSETRFATSETTIYVGGCMRSVAVQAAKTWINLVSSSGNAVYRVPNGERIFGCSSKPGLRRILIGLGDGDLRGRGRVCLLEVSPDGQIVEVGRKDFMQEIVDVTIINESSSAVASVDDSIYQLVFGDDGIRVKSHLKLNISIKSITAFSSGELLCSSVNGIIILLDQNFTVKSSMSVAPEPIFLGDPILVGDDEYVPGISQGKCVLISPNSTIARLMLPSPASSVSISNNLIFSATGGDLTLSKMPSLTHGPSPVFCPSLKVQIPSKARGSLQPDPSRDVYFVPLVNESPIMMRPSDKQCFSLFSLPPIDVAIVAGDCCILAHGSDSLSLIEMTTDDNFRVVWSLPFVEGVCAMTLLGDDKFAVCTDSGLISIWSLSRTMTPKQLAASQLSENYGTVKLLATARGRLFVVNLGTGKLITCFYRNTDRSLLITSVPEPDFSGSPATCCALVTESVVALGTRDGHLRLVEIPESVFQDEECGLPFCTSSSDPETCLTVNLVIADQELGPKAGIIDMLTIPGKPGFVFFSTDDGQMGVLRSLKGLKVDKRLLMIDEEVVDDETQRAKLRGGWEWE